MFCIVHINLCILRIRCSEYCIIIAEKFQSHILLTGHIHIELVVFRRSLVQYTNLTCDLGKECMM